MLTPEARSALSDLLAERVRFDVPLARHTSLRVGGPADALATPADRGELGQLLALCQRLQLPSFALGAGFNTLVRDGGLPGVVISLRRFRGLVLEGTHCLRAEAGVSHSQITNFCAQRGLAGLEFGAGIPGTVGGWIAMNAGTREREVRDVVRAVEILRPGAAATEEIPRANLDFHYRALCGLPPGTVIVAAIFQAEIATCEAVKKEIERQLAQRANTQPLDRPSCGSVFKNPPGNFAGRLIESAGLKGERVGDAEISTLHANFIINRGHARARDVWELIERARSQVAAQCGTQLELEVHVVGEET